MRTLHTASCTTVLHILQHDSSTRRGVRWCKRTWWCAHLKALPLASEAGTAISLKQRDSLQGVLRSPSHTSSALCLMLQSALIRHMAAFS